MRLPWNSLIVGGLVVLAAQTGCAPTTGRQGSAVGVAVGQEAPDIVTHDVAGKEVRLSGLRGKVVLLDFWATWCGPCKSLLPKEKDLAERLKDKPFVLVGLSIDQRRDDLTEFLAENKLPWTQWWDGPNGAAREWNIDGIPTTYVLDAKGVIRYEEEGVRPGGFEEMEKVIDGLLKDMDQKTD